MPRHDEKIRGAIEGLRLPPRAWAVLRRENIMTIDRLRAVVDRLQRFDGVGIPDACGCDHNDNHPERAYAGRSGRLRSAGA